MTKRGPNLTCGRCGCSFPQGSRGPNAKFCSAACYTAYRQESDWVANFWKKVDFTSGQGPTGDCWVWTGAPLNSPKRYGVFAQKGTNFQAHRLSYALAKGEITNGLWVLHRCDNVKCVNPDHLFLGTPKNNTDDMIGKDRNGRGSRQPRAKLNDDAVRKIRQLYKEGHGQDALAMAFQISQTLVSGIVRLEKWRHIT